MNNYLFRFVKNAIGNLVWIILRKSLDCPRQSGHFMILILSIQEHSISFHLFLSSSVSSISVLYFSKITSLQFSHSVVSHSIWPHRLQHSRLLCPSPTSGASSNSCPLSQWCHPSISSSVVPFSSCSLSYHQVTSKWVSLCIRWPKYWSFSFSINTSSEYSGLISFRIAWFDLLAGTLKSLLQHHS